MSVKRNAFFSLLLCLCLLLSALLSACGSTPSEEPSASAEESEVTSAVVDPNMATARGYLEELLTADEWLTADRAETIRESVKQLKTPILTEEDVLRIAERAAAFYLAAWQGRQTVLLPACGVLEAVRIDAGALSRYSEHAEAYNALLSYTLYLFTPPDYVFWGTEIWNEGWFPSNDAGIDPAAALCLPLAPPAGEYTNRSGALAAMQEGQSCIRLYPLLRSDGEHPLYFAYCPAADLLLNGEYRALELDTMAEEGDFLRHLHTLEYLEPRLDRCTYAEDDIPLVWFVDNPLLSSPTTICLPFWRDEAQTVREMTERLSLPLLTEGDVLGLLATFHEDSILQRQMSSRGMAEYPFLLPGTDGEEDCMLPTDMPVNQRSRRVIAYTVGLFTPSACRFTDLFDRPGAYYALNDGGYVLVTESYELYLVDASGGVTPLYTV